MKRSVLILGVLLLTIFNLYSQSNEMIDKLTGEKKADFGKTALLILTGAGLLKDSAQPPEALKYIFRNKWGFKNKTENSPVNAGELAYLIMKAFNLGGGLMYTLFPGPRYAYRELTFLNLLSSKGGPYREVSGLEVVNTLSRVLNWKEGE